MALSILVSLIWRIKAEIFGFMGIKDVVAMTVKLTLCLK